MTEKEKHDRKLRKELKRKSVRRGRRQNKEALRVRRLVTHGRNEIPTVAQFKPVYAEPPKATWISRVKGIIGKIGKWR